MFTGLFGIRPDMLHEPVSGHNLVKSELIIRISKSFFYFYCYFQHMMLMRAQLRLPIHLTELNHYCLIVDTFHDNEMYRFFNEIITFFRSERSQEGNN